MSDPSHDDGLSHDDTTDLTSVLAELRDEVRGLRDDVRTERKGRRTTFTFGAIVLAVSLIGGAGYIADLRAQSARDEARECVSRTQSRVEIRSAIAAAVDEVADFAEVTGDRRDALTGRVRDRVLDELPPPTC